MEEWAGQGRMSCQEEPPSAVSTPGPVGAQGQRGACPGDQADLALCSAGQPLSSRSTQLRETASAVTKAGSRFLGPLQPHRTPGRVRCGCIMVPI